MQPLFLATSLYTYALFLLNNRLITPSCYLIRCYCPHYFFRVRKNMNIIPFVIGTFFFFMNTHIICNLLSELLRLTLRVKVRASCFINPGYCHTHLAVFPKSPQALSLECSTPTYVYILGCE